MFLFTDDVPYKKDKVHHLMYKSNSLFSMNHLFFCESIAKTKLTLILTYD